MTRDGDNELARGEIPCAIARQHATCLHGDTCTRLAGPSSITNTFVMHSRATFVLYPRTSTMSGAITPLVAILITHAGVHVRSTW
jgi:hypothetical protein